MDTQKPVNEKGDDNWKHEQSCFTPHCPTLSLVPHLQTPAFCETKSQCEGGFPGSPGCNSLTMNVWLVLNSLIAENNAEFEAELG